MLFSKIVVQWLPKILHYYFPKSLQICFLVTLTVAFTWIVFSLSLIGLIFLIFRYYRKQIHNGSIRKLTIYTLLIIVNLSLVFGSSQFLIYFSDKNSFIIDKELLNFQQKKEIKKIEEIQEIYRREKKFCFSLNDEINSNGYFHPKFVQRYHTFGLFKDGSTSTYSFIYRNNQFDFQRIINKIEPPAPVPPSSSSSPKKESNDEDYYTSYFLTIKNDTIEIEIFQTKATIGYFMDFFKNADSISKSSVKQIINYYTTKINDKILQLDNNIMIIQNRGLPLSVFAFDTFLKSINQNQNYYKPLSWLSRILFVTQILIVLYFIVPLLNLSIKKLWGKVS